MDSRARTDQRHSRRKYFVRRLGMSLAQDSLHLAFDTQRQVFLSSLLGLAAALLCASTSASPHSLRYESNFSLQHQQALPEPLHRSSIDTSLFQGLSLEANTESEVCFRP
jgi:hypothetical protein